jgi:hypothetical protein
VGIASGFVELERQVLTVTFYLDPIHADSCQMTNDGKLKSGWPAAHVQKPIGDVSGKALYKN